MRIADGELQAFLPLDWDQVDRHVVGAQIQAANNAKHMYLAVSSTRRADTAGILENHADSDLQTSTRRLLDVTISGPSDSRLTQANASGIESTLCCRNLKSASPIFSLSCKQTSIT